MYKLAPLALCLCLLAHAAQATALRDPTKPPGISTQNVSGNGMQIDAIFYSKNRSSVVIGGHNFSVGDTIMGATIVAIEPTEIKFKDSRGEFTSVMSYSVIKSPIINTKTINEKKHEKPGKKN